MSLKRLLDNMQKGMDIVTTLEDEPIEPYIASVILEFGNPLLFGSVGTLEDFKDCLHCLEVSKFILWGTVWPPNPKGDLFTALTFRKMIGRFPVQFTLSVPNGIIHEYNHPKPSINEGEGDF